MPTHTHGFAGGQPLNQGHASPARDTPDRPKSVELVCGTGLKSLCFQIIGAALVAALLLPACAHNQGVYARLRRAMGAHKGRPYEFRPWSFPDQSGLAPENLITLAHFSLSSA